MRRSPGVLAAPTLAAAPAPARAETPITAQAIADDGAFLPYARSSPNPQAAGTAMGLLRVRKLGCCLTRRQLAAVGGAPEDLGHVRGALMGRPVSASGVWLRGDAK
jgi:hypothetical protein